MKYISLTFSLFFLFSLQASYAEAQSNTPEDLQAQIKSLLEVVVSLNEQVKNLQGNESSTNTNLVSRNLKVGDDHPDVTTLQTLLNLNPVTRVALTGPGSPGNESSFFGNLTKAAVIRFQELHRDQILTPVNLTKGTGFVGPSTRARLAQFSAALQKAKTTETKNTTTPKTASEEEEQQSAPVINVEISAPPVEAEELSSQIYITNLSNYYILPDETITIFGNGFALNNRVRLGDVWYENVLRLENSNLQFVIPEEVDPGVYEIVVDNGLAQSLSVNVVVTVEDPVAPIIESVSPAVISEGTVVTLRGKGFTPTGNMAFMDEFDIRDLTSSDGETIVFTFKRPGFDETKFSQDALDALGPDAVAFLKNINPAASQGVERGIVIGLVNANGRSELFETKFK